MRSASSPVVAQRWRLLAANHCVAYCHIYSPHGLVELLQLDTVGDITKCTFSGNSAVSGQAVYSFDSVSTLSTNGYENEPFDALFLDQSLGFNAAVLVAG